MDATGPSAESFPAKKDLTVSSPVVFIFNESIDTSSVVLGDTMADDCDGGVWSTTAYANDTLTISPLTEWDNTSPLKLSIDCKDLYGNEPKPAIKAAWNKIQ